MIWKHLSKSANYRVLISSNISAVLVSKFARASSSIPASDTRNLKELRLLKIKENNTTPFPRYTQPKFTIGKGSSDSANEIKYLKQKYSEIKPGEKLQNEKVYIEGRIFSKRTSGNKLCFYFIYKNGQKIQVVSSLGNLESPSDKKYNTQSQSQAFAAQDQMAETLKRDFKKLNKFLHVGDIIRVTGYIGRTQTGEISIYSTENLELLSTCYSSIPYLSKLESTPTRFRNRHVDFLVNESARNTVLARAKILSAIRHFFDSRGFVEVETPILWPKLGGANAKPFCTKATALGNSELFLRISPELFLKDLIFVVLLLQGKARSFLRLVIGGFDKVYEIGKSFRNEGIDKSHNPEFTSCEFYQAYVDINDLMNTTELLLQDIVKKLNKGSTMLEVVSESKLINKDLEEPDNKSRSGPGPGPESEPSSELQNITLDFGSPFKRINVVEFLSEKLECSLDFLASSEKAHDTTAISGSEPDKSESHLQMQIQLQDRSHSIVEKLLKICNKHNIKTSGIPLTPNKILDLLISIYIEPECVQPTFLTDHPIFMSPLAKAKNYISSARFELFINKREYVNAYEELNDPDEQRVRFVNQINDRNTGDHEATLPDNEFCDALEFALPPTGGWGLGVDRLVSLVTNSPNLRETISFPVIK